MTNYLPDDLYKLVAKQLPLVCVDVIPARQIDNQWQIGAITRATGSQTGKLALIGGRIQYGETIKQAIQRHLKSDLGLKTFNFFKNSEDRPFYIGQYDHAEKSSDLFDPTKQSVALTYLIEISDSPQARNEASAFHWLGKAELPKSAAYNQQQIMIKAFEALD